MAISTATVNVKCDQCGALEVLDIDLDIPTDRSDVVAEIESQGWKHTGNGGVVCPSCTLDDESGEDDSADRLEANAS